MEVKIIEGCIGCGLCEGICPEVFKLNDEGLSEVISQPDKNSVDSVLEAADGCPVSVIIVDKK